MNNRNKSILLGLSMLTIPGTIFSAEAVTFTNAPFSAAFHLGQNILKRPQVVIALSMLSFLVISLHESNNTTTLTDEQCSWDNFNADVSAAIDALVHGRASEFCSSVHTLWRIYCVGRSAKFVPTRLETLQDDGSVLTIKDKKKIRSNFGFCGWLYSVAGTFKDISEKFDPVPKGLAVIGACAILKGNN